MSKNEGVLFHCYKCDVDMIQLGNGDYQCPECKEVAQFEIPDILRGSLGKAITDEG